MVASTKRNLVIDASFVLAFLIPDEQNLEVDQVFNQYKTGLINLISTPLLPFEVANGLNMASLRKRITKNYAKARIKEFLRYEIELKEVDVLQVLLRAQKANITVYDASYLYLARKNRLQLLTLDSNLEKLTQKK